MARKFEVGYRKPPKHTQFRKGKSGNPKGRTKSSKNSNQDLQKELSEKIVIRENGVTRSIPKKRAVSKALVNEAMKGNTRAIQLVKQYEASSQDEKFDETAKQMAAIEEGIFLRFAPDLLNKLKRRKPK